MSNNQAYRVLPGIARPSAATSDEALSTARSSPQAIQLLLDEQEAAVLKRDALPPSWSFEVSWQILVETFINQSQGRTTRVKNASIAANAPSATAARHIALLVDEGWIVRSSDPRDQRVVNLQLTLDAVRIFRRWFDLRASQFTERFE